MTGINGLHFHNLCEQGFAPLSRTLDTIEETFSDILPSLQWLNLGGGHHITANGYDRTSLIKRIKELQQKYQLQIYLEPGEAIAINCGVLACEVLDVVDNEGLTAIVDTSATCHMPDVLEMPYTPLIFHSTQKNIDTHDYRIAGLSCLAGDLMGEYSFTTPLHIGQRLLFDDMAHYTMVKTNTFNGVPLPSLALWNSSTNALKVIKSFSYNDFKQRLS